MRTSPNGKPLPADSSVKGVHIDNQIGGHIKTKAELLRVFSWKTKYYIAHQCQIGLFLCAYLVKTQKSSRIILRIVK